MQEKLHQEQREIQRDKAEMQERIQKQNIELLKWKRELEEEMQRERLEIEREKLKMEEKKGESSQKTICKAKTPVFSEENDKMDVYLSRFESVANLMKWQIEEWPLQLSVLLTGNAPETFYGLTNEQQKEYALLRRYSQKDSGRSYLVLNYWQVKRQHRVQMTIFSKLTIAMSCKWMCRKMFVFAIYCVSYVIFNNYVIYQVISKIILYDQSVVNQNLQLRI